MGAPGRFANVEKVEPTARGVPFKTGNYRVRVAAVKAVTGQQGDVFYIIEAMVLESNSPEAQVGEKRSQVINTTNKKARNAPFRDIKAFVCAVLSLRGDEHEHVTEEMIEYTCLNNEEMPGGPFEGVELDLQCSERPPQPPEKPNPFTYHAWSNPDPDMSETIANHFVEMGLLAPAE